MTTRPFDALGSYLRLPFKLDEASLPKLTRVKITGDDTVGAVTSSSDLCIGELDVTVGNTTGLATVRTIFRRVLSVKLMEIVVAGDVGAESSKSGSGSTTEISWGKETSQTLTANRGVFLQGGIADDYVEVGVL